MSPGVRFCERVKFSGVASTALMVTCTTLVTMSPRTRWYLRVCGPAIPLLVVAVLFLVTGEALALVFVTAGAGVCVAVQGASSLYLFRAGYFRGRADQLVAEERIRSGRWGNLWTAYPNPWDPWPLPPERGPEDVPRD